MTDETTFDKLVRIKGQNFLAKTGDKKSIIALLHGVCDEDKKVSQYALEAVFNNPQAYQELMDLNSAHRIKVIHHFSESDVYKAIEFSQESLHSEDTNIKLLALDVLDYNIAYLDARIQIQLKPLLVHQNERLRVKASRLLILLSDYEEIDLIDCDPISIMEDAMESDDLICRQMAFGMPSSVFYKLKHVKTTIEDLQDQIQSFAKEATSLKAEITAFQANVAMKDQKIEELKQVVSESENKHSKLINQYSSIQNKFNEKEKMINLHKGELDKINRELKDIQDTQQVEKEQAKKSFNNLIHDYKARENQFKKGFNEVFAKAQDKIHELALQKQELQKQLKELKQENLSLKEALDSKQLSRY